MSEVVIRLKKLLKLIFLRLYIFPQRLLNAARYFPHRRGFFSSTPKDAELIRRTFKYDRKLLPNNYVRELELKSENIEVSREKMKSLETGFSIGYPAWNLLYYSLICTLEDSGGKEAVIVETGTNAGFSTIMMAQALKDKGIPGCVYTVDIDEKMVALARQHVEAAGLSAYVKFHALDSLVFLRDFVREKRYINFAFLDGLHECEHIKQEFAIIYPKVLTCGGKVYFDNTIEGGVTQALYFIKHAYGGNMLEFRGCSWLPPGNVIWQPEWSFI